MVTDNMPRNSWPLGKVVDVIQDKRGVARIAKIKTKNSVIDRPINKLCLVLEANFGEQN